MTWPASAVNTTNTDDATDNPATARSADILAAIQALNQIIAHVSAADVKALLAVADNAAFRSTLGLGALATLGQISPSLINFAATDKLAGRSSAGGGAGEEVSCTAAGRALIDDANADAQLTTLGGGSVGVPIFKATTQQVARESAGIVLKRKTADESVTSSTTLQDDDHLFLTLAANEEWVVSYRVIAGAALNTTGWRVGFTAPAGATVQHQHIRNDPGASGNVLPRWGRDLSAALFVGEIPANSLAGVLWIDLWVLNGGTAGDLKLQFAQQSSSTTPLTFLKGSWMRAERLA